MQHSIKSKQVKMIQLVELEYDLFVQLQARLSPMGQVGHGPPNIATGIKRSKLNALSISCRRTHALCTRTCRTNGLRQLERTWLEWQSVTQVTSPSIQEKISAFPSESLDLGIVHASQNGLKTFPFFTTMLKRMLYSVIFA